MERLIDELKYAGFNFLILLYGYFYLYKPANALRDKFQQKYGSGIKSSNILNDGYKESGKEHVHLYLLAILIFVIVIIIAIIILLFAEIYISTIIQIVIAGFLVIFSFFNMINAYIATIVIGSIAIGLIGFAIISASNSR